MSSRSCLLRSLALSTTLFVASLSSANAVEANAVAERIRQLFVDSDIDLTWTSVGGSGSAVTLEGTTLKVPDAEAPVPIGTVRFDDVTDKDGGYRIGKVTIPAFTVSGEGQTTEVSSVTATGVTLLAAGAVDPLGVLTAFETLDVATQSVFETPDRASVSVKGGTPAHVAVNLHAETTPPANGGPSPAQAPIDKISANLSVKFNVDSSAVSDPVNRKLIEGMGYQTLSGTLQSAGSWQPTDGRLRFTTHNSYDNIGKSSQALDIGGFSLDFIKSLAALHQKTASPTDDSKTSAQELAILGSLTFYGATVRFDDASITDKILDHIAKLRGQTRSDIVNQAMPSLPILMAQLENPEFTQTVIQAVNAYLDNPKSFEIKASPAQPITFAMVAASAIASLKDLPKMLGVTVTANQPASEEQ